MLERLRLSRFRRIDDADLELHPGTNLLHGANAQGKTTVLEAVGMLSLGRSFRTARDRECIAWSAPEDGRFAAAEGWIAEGAARRRLRVAIEPDGKSVWLDGRMLRALSELWGVVRTVAFAPSDLRLVADGPAHRRAVLDVLLGQIAPGHLAALSDYRRALANRNSLLKARTPPGDGRYPAFEDAMARAAARAMAERARLVLRLSDAAKAAVAELTGGAEDLAIHYEPGSSSRDAAALGAGALAGGDEAALAEAWRAAWARERPGDAERLQTRHGPHRDDLRFELDGADARTFASQGQARTCALALRLAELEVHAEVGGRAPILLLDDILGELDARRAEGFLAIVARRGVQTLLTATDAQGVERSLHIDRAFRVEAGAVAPG